MKLLKALCAGIVLGATTALFLWGLLFSVLSLTANTDDNSGWHPPQYNIGQ